MRTSAMIGAVCLMSLGAFLSCGCSTALYEAGTMGLEGYWALDEAAGDRIENAVGPNDGRVQGGLQRVDGKRGKALAFDGSGYVLIDSADYLNAARYTFAAWVRLKNTGDFQYIVWRGGPEFPEPEERRHLDIWVTMEGTLSGILDYRDPSQGRFRLDGAATVADDRWHLVACVCDGKTVTFYVDGKKDVEGDLAGPLATSSWPVWSGARPGDVAATGVMDEVKFFARALTPEQVAGLE